MNKQELRRQNLRDKKLTPTGWQAFSGADDFPRAERKRRRKKGKAARAARKINQPNNRKGKS